MIPPEVLEELYGVDPDEFVATRTRLAKEAREGGDRERASEIGELRKPTVAAWALNLVVRDRPVEVDRLLDLGRRMRAAQSQLDVDALRALRVERETALDGFTRAARFVADAHGHGLSMSAATAIRSTGVAALADEAAADALAGGALVRTLEYAGFGEVDVSDAIAAPHALGRRRERSAPTPEGADATTGEASEDAGAPAVEADTATEPETTAASRRRLARLEQEAADADRELARASLVEAERERLAEKAARRLADLTRLMEAAATESRASAEAAQAAREERETAADAYEQARQRLESARENHSA